MTQIQYIQSIQRIYAYLYVIQYIRAIKAVIYLHDAKLVTNNLRFPGQYYDAETGKHYNWNRYYDPKIGRYISEDPIGFEAGDQNLYRYGYNSPLNGIDPYGLDWLQNLSDFSAGFGDTVTSGFGLTHLVGLPSLTEYVRHNWENNLDWKDPVNKCAGSYKGGEIAGYAWGVAANVAGYKAGYEFTVGKNIRIAPWGNRTGHPYGKLPHYHRGAPKLPDGSRPPGQGKGPGL